MSREERIEKGMALFLQKGNLNCSAIVNSVLIGKNSYQRNENMHKKQWTGNVLRLPKGRAPKEGEFWAGEDSWNTTNESFPRSQEFCLVVVLGLTGPGERISKY